MHKEAGTGLERSMYLCIHLCTAQTSLSVVKRHFCYHHSLSHFSAILSRQWETFLSKNYFRAQQNSAHCDICMSITCCKRSASRRNASPHLEQLKSEFAGGAGDEGASPDGDTADVGKMTSRIRAAQLCFIIWIFWMKPLPQSEHLNGRSPECTRTWCRRLVMMLVE